MNNLEDNPENNPALQAAAVQVAAAVTLGFGGELSASAHPEDTPVGTRIDIFSSRMGWQANIR